ncbi:MAG: DUF1836 domain-containing protein [Oscillospiraceae bacterium]|nr:DUF1836 domain-containing protein [Oscillospiraceae bacterium]
MESITRLSEYRCPRYQDFPSIPLYKDQVVSFLTQTVTPFYQGVSAPVTASMINNYVKLKVLTPPEKKKYSRDQVICLYVIFLLKQVLSMDEIRLLLLREFAPDTVESSYVYFSSHLESVLKALSNHSLSDEPEDRPLLDAAIRSFVYKQCASALLREDLAQA